MDRGASLEGGVRPAQEVAAGHDSHCDGDHHGDTFCQADVDLIRLARIDLLEELVALARTRSIRPSVDACELSDLLLEAKTK
jgi:hypothetical protein